MKRPDLIWNWKRVLLYGWNVRLVAISVALQIADGALPYLQDLLPDGTFRWASVVVGAGAIVARVISQRSVSNA